MHYGRDGIRPRPRLGWLAAIVPVAARRFRVRDREFAAVISAGGGELVDSSPDVEITAAGELVGGLFWENYAGGSGLMAGSVFGRIAGRSAARKGREVSF